MRTCLAIRGIVIAAVVVFLFATIALATSTPATVGFSVPLPGSEGVNFSGQNGLFNYIGALYKFGLILGTFFAVLMIVWGGIEYTTSAGNPSRQGDAKDRIMNALYGLVLLLAVVLILRTLNPEILRSRNSSVSGGGGNSEPNLSTPSNLVITTLSNGSYRLSWNDNSEEDFFLLEYGDAQSGSNWYPFPVNAGAVASSPYEFFKPQGGEYYRLTAVSNRMNPTTQQPYKGPASASVGLPQTGTGNISGFGAPTITNVFHPSNDNAVFVGWRDNSSDESGFRIEGLGISFNTLSGGAGSASSQWYPLGTALALPTPAGQQGLLTSFVFNQINGNILYTRVKVVAYKTENGAEIVQVASEAPIPSSQNDLPDPNAFPILVRAVVNNASSLFPPTLSLTWIDNASNENGFRAEALPTDFSTSEWTSFGGQLIGGDATTATLSFGSSSIFAPGNTVRVRIVAVAPSCPQSACSSNDLLIQIPQNNP